ncbi:hypothetical protein QYE76_032162 [Lolium multiflorum]|uniref:RNase H type-1 domain-containing protein n=1 Tax=Lolium multiflorum TaxID=4521 RepID=A0AAD8QWA8_LOLMU|nr:hypothetical protein QYE76_032162 [Lolium multiflorum]
MSRFLSGLYGMLEERQCMKEYSKVRLRQFCFIERFIADLELIKAPAQQRRVSAGVVPRWIPPPPGVAKVNVDAALSKDERLAAVAAVARDVDGHFLGASVLTCRGISDPETMEAVACREGLALASDLNLQRIRLASDCANVVRIQSNERVGDLQWQNLIHDGEMATMAGRAWMVVSVRWSHVGEVRIFTEDSVRI